MPTSAHLWVDNYEPLILTLIKYINKCYGHDHRVCNVSVKAIVISNQTVVGNKRL